MYHPDHATCWNADRIFESIDDWTIFAYNQGDTPMATIFLTGDEGHYEIYGVEFVDDVFSESTFGKLVVASLNACKRLDAKYMTYFCGEEEKQILNELGFRCIGQYVLYIKEF